MGRIKAAKPTGWKARATAIRVIGGICGGLGSEFGDEFVEGGAAFGAGVAPDEMRAEDGVARAGDGFGEERDEIAQAAGRGRGVRGLVGGELCGSDAHVAAGAGDEEVFFAQHSML